jgi:quercetin dioxygenase-like cupin family protein
VTLGEFFAAAASKAEEEQMIVRAADRRRLDSTWTDVHLEALGSMSRSRRLEPVLAVFGAGGRSGKHPHSHPHEEFAFVLRGSVTLTLGNEENELEPGDSVTLPRSLPPELGEPGQGDRRGAHGVDALPGLKAASGASAARSTSATGSSRS